MILFHVPHIPLLLHFLNLKSVSCVFFQLRKSHHLWQSSTSHAVCFPDCFMQSKPQACFLEHRGNQAKLCVSVQLQALFEWALILKSSVSPSGLDLFYCLPSFGFVCLFILGVVGVFFGVSLAFSLIWMWYVYSHVWDLILWLHHPGQ